MHRTVCSTTIEGHHTSRSRGNLGRVLAVVLGFALLVPPIAQAQSTSAEQVFKEVAASVVVVISQDGAGRTVTFGSGVKLDGDLVATNCHVTENGVSYEVRYRGLRYPATLAAGDARQDVCLLAVPNLPAHSARIGSTSDLHVGAHVFAVGAPEGLEQTVSEGIVSGLRSAGPAYNYIQTTAAISHGSSGGGLFNSRGRLIGLTTFTVRDGQQLNFALPVEWVTFAADGVNLARRLGVKTQHPMDESAALEKKGDWDGLEGLARDWIRFHPERARVWYTLGVALLNQDKYADARAAFAKSLELLPDRGSDAWDIVDVHLYPPPTEGEVWFELALACSFAKQYPAAIAAYHESIKHNPDAEPTWYNLGLAYAQSGQGNEAIDAFREAVRLDPGDPNAWYNLGAAYHQNGQQSRAINVHSVLMRLDPDRAQKLFDYISSY